ncbi:MAG: DUF4058 family protein [Roseiflexus sp.]|nr:DUF4058 family protein [Roseiflexus sp.]MCS7291133.1 DUF4058 family protein [Roseiflexus sp.]MDW8146245.1 DUF4058 family protein [Roseiflexaceae bacterium]MDW8234477.1 DUF4058 family protein [Roseiflexaceae bacterium]
MQSPFPGMDPYLEAVTIWPDVHAGLISAMRRQLQPRLSPQYVAAIAPCPAFETIDINLSRFLVPEIAIVERDQQSSVTATTVAPAPVVGALEVEIETRHSRLEVRTVGDETVVTAIALLSPANKRPSADAADAYERKRREIIRSPIHLLEIDLLPGGRRPPLATPWPPAPYVVMLSRADQRPQVEIWPIQLQDLLPIVPVPLRAPDPDVPLDLSAALNDAYAEGRYNLRIDYRNPPPPPPLTPADEAWHTERLAAAGLR